MQTWSASPYSSQSLHESMPSPLSLSVSRSRRSRILRACIACRRRKIKCNGDLDGCAYCKQTEQQCRYEPVSDDDKLRARSYKRKLIQRRQQTMVYFGGPTYLEPAFLAVPYGMPSGTGGCYAPRSSVNPSPAHMQQFSPDFHPAIPGSMSTDSYVFLSSYSSESPTQLQHINSSTSFSHTILAPMSIESLSPLSLSPSSSESSVMTPVDVSDQMHLPDFVGGLQACTVPYIDTIPGIDEIAGLTANCGRSGFVELTPSAPSPELSTLSSADHFFQPLMAEFQITASHYKSTVDANTSTLAGAFA